MFTSTISQNFTKSHFFLSFDPKGPWICTKNNRVPVLIVGNTHTKLNLIGPGSLDLSCLQAQFQKKSQQFTESHFFLSFDPKIPWICTKNSRLPVLIVRNTHTKFKLARTRQSGLIVFTSKISQNYT